VHYIVYSKTIDMHCHFEHYRTTSIFKQVYTICVRRNAYVLL